jgi:hypothetical protein
METRLELLEQNKPFNDVEYPFYIIEYQKF